MLLKSFKIFGTALEKNPRRDSCSQVFYKMDAMLESLFKKVSRNKETPAQVIPCEFCEAFKNTFFTEQLRWSWSLSFKMFYV